MIQNYQFQQKNSQNYLAFLRISVQDDVNIVSKNRALNEKNLSK